jgi:hypothetical protein
MPFSDLAMYWVFWTLVALVGVLTALLIAFVIRLVAKPGTVYGGSGLAQRLQRAWHAPMLKDPELAERIVEITTAPVLKEDYRTTITVSSDHAGTARARIGSRTGPVAIRLDIETSFRFANVTSDNLNLRINQSGEIVMSVTKKPTLRSVRVGEDVLSPRSSDGEIAFYDIAIPAESSRLVSLTSSCQGELPLILELPQTTVLRSGATIRVTSSVQGRIGLVVVGSPDASYCDDWYQGGAHWERTVKTDKPLLPGESIILFVGPGKARLPGRSLLDSMRETKE